MKRIVALTLLLAVAGCHLIVNPGELKVGLVGATASGPEGGSVALRNGFLSLTLDCEHGCVLGEARLGDGPNLINTSAEGTEEFLSGISYFGQSYSRQATAPQAEVLASGLVAQVRVRWSTVTQPGAPTLGDSMTNGVSVYTLHPDGRLHRNESFQTAQAPGQSYLLAYLSLAAARFSDVEFERAGVGLVHQVKSDASSTDGPEDGWACAVGVSTAEAVGWGHHSTADSHFVSWRLWPVDFGQPSFNLLFASDWSVEAAPGVSATSFTGEILNMFDRRADCERIQAAMKAFQAPGKLTANPGLVLTDQPGDRDQDGFNEGGGYFELSTNGGASIVATKTGETTLPTSTFRIQTPSSTPPTVRLGTRDLTAQVEFLYDHSASDTGWLFLAVPFAAGDSLTLSF